MLEIGHIFSQTIQLGSGTTTNGTTTSSPVNIWYRRTVAQFVYTAAEINAAGISGPCDLQDLGWFVTQSPIYNLPGYTVKVKHVTTNNVSAALGTTGWTTIKGPFTYNPTAGGWDMLGLDNTFSWNGTDNIGVEVCWSQVSPSYSSSGQCRIYSTSSGYRYSWTDGAGNSCGSTPFTTNTNKPQVQMVWSCGPPCTTPAPPSVLGVTVNCGNPATLTASGAPGNGDYIWYSDANGNNQVGTGSSFTTPSLNGNTTYYVSTFVPANCESSLTPVTVNVNSNVSAPSSSNININCGDPATLTASGSTGNYEWYSDANGTNSIGTGNSISLGNLFADSTVYVAATTSTQTNGSDVYNIDLNNLVGVPSGTTNTRYNCGNSGQGFQWTDATPAGATITSITLEFKIGVECATGNKNSTLNNVSQPNFNSANNHCSTASPGPGSFITMNLNPGSYNIGTNNVFSTSGHGSCFGFERSSTLSNYFARVTVNYTVGSPGCFSNLVPVTAIVNGPNPPTANGVTINCGDPATLTASGSTGNYEWFSDANGNNSMGTGNSISLGNLYADSTVYVAATSGSSCTPQIETFDNNSIPSGWTSTNSTGSTALNAFWKYGGTLGYNMNPTNDNTGNGGSFAWVDGSTPYPIEVTLNSPTYPQNNYTTLSFYMKRAANTTITSFNDVSVDFYDGSTWNNGVFTHNTSTASSDWEQFTINLTGFTITGPVQFRFNVDKNGTPYPFYDDVAIDDVELFCGSNSCLSNLVPVTAIVNPTPGPTVSGNTPLCGSGSLTLTANGSGNPIEWYSDPGGTNLIANGSTFTTPTLTNNITYYVQEAAASTNQTFTYTSPVSSTNTTGGSVSINIPATPPNSTNGTLTVYLIGDLDGSSETVTIGSETGNLGTVFTGSQCSSTYWNTTYNITTNDLNTWTANGSVDLNFQASNAVNNICSGGTAFEVYVVLTYDYSSGSSCTSALTPVNVTIDQPSIVATGVSGIGSTCLGSTSTLTVQGGTLNGTSNWQWFSGSCNGTPVGTGTSITVTPTTTTTYYVSASANGACPATTCTSGTVTLPTQTNQLSINNSTSTCIVNDNNFVHFLDANGRLIASINSQGQNLGNVTATSFIESTPLLVQDCAGTISTSVLDRHWLIQPTVTNPGAPVIVRLPLNNTELNSLITESNNNTNSIDDVNGLTDIYLSKYSGPSNLDNDFVNNCPSNGGNGNTQIYPQVTNGILNNIGLFANYPASDFYIEFVIPNFSEFWLHGSNIASPLPVTFTDFSAECGDKFTTVKWSTASEQNSSHFTLERSSDGNNWQKIATIEAQGNSSNQVTYEFNDSEVMGLVYYRLKQYDNDGVYSQLSPISADCNTQNFDAKLYPNPTQKLLNIELANAEFTDDIHSIIIHDMQGRMVDVEIIKHSNSKKVLDVNKLKEGVYNIQINTNKNGESINKRFTVIK